MNFVIAIDSQGDAWFVPSDALFLSVLEGVSITCADPDIISLTDLDRRTHSIHVTDEQGDLLQEQVALQQTCEAVRQLVEACKTDPYHEPGFEQVKAAYLGSLGPRVETHLTKIETLAIMHVVGGPRSTE